MQDLLLATYDGQVSAYRDTGERIRLVDDDGRGGLAFPRLRVRTLWYEGLAADPTSHEHPDLGQNKDAQRELEKKLVEEALRARGGGSVGGGSGGGVGVGRRRHRRRRRRSLMQVANDAAAATSSVEAEAKATFDELFGEQGTTGGGSGSTTTTTTTTFADANDAGAASSSSLSASDQQQQQLQREQLTPDQMAALLAEGIDAAEIEGIQERLANEAEAEIEAAENAQTGSGIFGGDNAELWGEDPPEVERLPSLEALRNAGVVENAAAGNNSLPEFVLVDAHVLAAPVVADVDGDGHDELVAAVS